MTVITNDSKNVDNFVKNDIIKLIKSPAGWKIVAGLLRREEEVYMHPIVEAYEKILSRIVKDWKEVGKKLKKATNQK